MRINYNKSAVLSNACVNDADRSIAKCLERLSSGYKINHSKDNPAGLAIANRMNSQVEGFGVAKNNTNDGISVVETADGAMSEIASIVQRMSELAVSAGHDVKTDSDREIIDKEIQQLKSEITRIATDTEFNGQVLLDGTFDLKAYTDNPDLTVSYYSQEVIPGQFSVNIASGILTPDTSVAGEGFSRYNSLNVEELESNDPDVKKARITAENDFEMIFEYSSTMADGTVNIDVTGMGAMKIQTGANEGQEVGIVIREISLKKMGIDDLNVATFESAQEAIGKLKGALEYVNDSRSRIGAYQNRLEHNVTSIEITSENMTASYSRIMDVDMAEEMTEYSSKQVILQSSISMLAQANERPQQILQLLQ